MSANNAQHVRSPGGSVTASQALPKKVKSGNVASTAGKHLPQAGNAEAEIIANKLQTAVQAIGRDLRFQVDMVSGRSVIQVFDRETGEMIRQIPPEDARTFLAESGDVKLRLYDDRV